MFGDKEVKNKNRIKKHLVDYLGIILIVGISTIYLFKGFFSPEWSNIPFWIRIMDGIVSIVVAISIQSSMGLQAIINGMKLEVNKDLAKEHVEVIRNANDYIEYADEYFDVVNKDAYRTERTKELSKVGLKYSLYFDKDGVYTGETIEEPKGLDKDHPLMKQYRRRVDGLTKSLNVEVTIISFDAISASDSSSGDANDLGETPMKYQAKKTKNKILSKFVYVAILSQVTWTLISGRTAWEQLFNGALQIGLYLVIGGIDYYTNWIYMVDTHPYYLRKKINHAYGLINYGKDKIQRGEIDERRRQDQSSTETIKHTEFSGESKVFTGSDERFSTDAGETTVRSEQTKS